MKHNTRNTVPVVNLLRTDNAFWVDWLTRVNHTIYYPTSNLVQAHKRVFGRQSYCWTSHRRFWIWEFEGYRIFVSNGYGMQMEVEPGLTDTEKIKGFMNEYVEAWASDGH